MKGFLRVGDGSFVNIKHIAWCRISPSRIDLETVTNKVFYINDADVIAKFIKDNDVQPEEIKS